MGIGWLTNNKKRSVSWAFIWIFASVALWGCSSKESSDHIDRFTGISVLEDTSGLLSAEEAWEQIDNFQPLLQLPGFGESNSHFWFLIDSQKIATDEQHIWLEIINPVIDYIDVYSIDIMEGNTPQFKILTMTGDMRPFSSRPLPMRNFLIPMHAQTPYYLVELYGVSPLTVPFRLGTPEQVISGLSFETGVVYALFGVMASMLLYNAFLFLGTGLRIYGWYLVYMSSIFMFLVFTSGLGFKYVWSESVWLQNNLGYAFIALFLWGAFNFTRSFLGIPELLPRFDRYFYRWFVWLPLTMLLAMLVYRPLTLPIGTLLLLIFSVLAPSLSAYGWYRKRNSAGLFLVSWSCMIIGMLVYNLVVAGVLPLTFFTFHAGEIGVAIESVLLSFALAFRIRDNERQAAERERASFERLQEALQMVEQSNAAKDAFLSTTSHQLKTPIHSLLGHLQLLASQTELLDAEPRKFVLQADKSAMQLMFHVDNLFTYSQVVANDLVPLVQKVHLRGELHRLADAWNEMMVPEGRHLVLNLDDSVPEWTELDWLHIRKILRIALENAFSAASEGEVSLSVRSAQENNQCWLFCQVVDSGEGYQPEVLAWFNEIDISAPWQTSSSGLYLCRYLNAVVSGNITLSNAPHGGAQFELKAPHRSGTTENHELCEDFNGKRILIVDDVYINRHLLEVMLKKINASPVSVDSGEAAIERIQTEHFDAVLMDCQMPLMTGLEATRLIRRLNGQFSHVPIIAVSANDSDADRSACLSAGMDDFIAKPVRMQHLKLILSIWL